MKTLTIEDIRDLSPCYDPVKYLSKNWKGNVIDILDVNDCPVEDRIWVVTKLLDDKTNRLFAVDCAKRALDRIEDPDPRSLKAVEIAEKYAYGNATDKELGAAWDAANSAACDANSAARSAAYAAYYAARDAASSAAWDAAWSAAWSAARDAWDAAYAARGAEKETQIERFKEIILQTTKVSENLIQE